MLLKGIKNIIFDFGGVICDLLPERCIEEFRALGVSEELLPKGYCQFDGVYKLLDRGEIGEKEFYDYVRQHGKVPMASDSQILQAWLSVLGPIARERFSLLRRLKENYNLFILSNANVMHWDFLDKEMMSFEGEYVTAWFKEVFLSYKLHLEKPEKEIYQAVIEKANLKAEETLFIDDSLLNLQQAALLGIKTLHSTGGDWVEKLERCI